MTGYKRAGLVQAPIDHSVFEKAVLDAIDKIRDAGSHTFDVNHIEHVNNWIRDTSTSVRIAHLLERYDIETYTLHGGCAGRKQFVVPEVQL